MDEIECVVVGAGVVGLTAGASAPPYLVDEVVADPVFASIPSKLSKAWIKMETEKSPVMKFRDR